MRESKGGKKGGTMAAKKIRKPVKGVGSLPVKSMSDRNARGVRGGVDLINPVKKLELKRG